MKVLKEARNFEINLCANIYKNTDVNIYEIDFKDFNFHINRINTVI